MRKYMPLSKRLIPVIWAARTWFLFQGISTSLVLATINGYLRSFDAVFLWDVPTFVPEIWEYGNFSVGTLIFTLCSPGNQQYQKIIYFFLIF